MDKQNVIKAMFWTKVKLAVAACAALVLAIGGAVLAQPAPTAEGAKPPPAKNIVQVAADGSGDYKTDGTDDHVEINQALQDIHKKGGGTVHLKKGTYVIDDSIIMRSNTTLEGDGWSSVITVKDDHDWPRGRTLVTNERGAHDIAIRNLKIDGKRDKWKARTGNEGWGGPYQRGIDLVRASNATLSGLWVGNNRGDAIHTLLSKNITIQDCNLEDCGHDDIYFYKSDTVRVINNRMHLRCNHGIRVYGTNHAVIRGNIFHPVLKSVQGKGAMAISLQSHGGGQEMNDILIEGNTVFGTAGIDMEMDSLPAKPGLLRAVVRNNVIYHCSYGIMICNYDALIENNTIFNNRSYGIGFMATGWRGGKIKTPDFPVTVTVRNNIIANNRGPGLTTSGLSGVRILSSYNNVWKNKGGDYVGNVTVDRDISVDPLFVKTDVPFTHGMPVQLKMDLHLKSQHGRWDGKKWVKDDVTSPCMDAGDPSFAYSKEPTPNGGRINMGAYGNTEHASKSIGTARGAIAGKVTDKTTGKPVSGVKVTTGGYFATTDADGKYAISDVPVGNYKLTASAIKYDNLVRDGVKVSKDGKTVADLALEKERKPPAALSHSPTGKNPVGKIISVTFSEAMNTNSAEKTFSISPSVAGSFRWIGNAMYFVPDAPLKYAGAYKVTIEGAEDLAGNKLASPHTWQFSTLDKAGHLVGEWRFEEKSGDTAKDTSGRGNHGTLKGDPAGVEGKVGRALSFDGKDDRVKISHSDSLVAAEEITIEAWVKSDVPAVGGGIAYGIVSKDHQVWRPNYWFCAYVVGKKNFTPVFIYQSAGPNTCGGRGPGQAFGSWVYLAATRDFHGNVKFYVDGKQTRATKTDPVTETIRSSAKPGPFWIGWYVNGGYFKGVIDEVRIYNRALSAAEIKADFGRGKQD